LPSAWVPAIAGCLACIVVSAFAAWAIFERQEL
jgi:hypothetical protein